MLPLDKLDKIVGIDEAGRGCLAGPVVAACAYLSDTFVQECPSDILPLIRDSKQLSHSQREKAYAWLIEHILYSIAESSSECIDEKGIKQANYRAMKDSLRTLPLLPQKVLVDGCDGFVFDIPSEDIIKGDEKELCISAASILAKVFRDTKMKEYDMLYPEYGFAKHNGYGTQYHLQMIQKYGICPIHRKTYEPIVTWLHQPSLF